MSLSLMQQVYHVRKSQEDEIEEEVKNAEEPIFDFDPEPLGWGENGSGDNFMIKN